MKTAYYWLDPSVTATVPTDADTPFLKTLWHHFCYRASTLNTQIGTSYQIGIGNATYLPLQNGEEYTVCIRPDGIGICGQDRATLMRGFSAFLIQIEMTADGRLRAACQDIRGRFSISRRMIHLCVFPETSLPTLARLVRLCGVLSYTHVVLEFWGTLRYDCLRELAWPEAFDKEDIRPILQEARVLGMEPIPMVNHLGHASSSRIDCGKHVVLDQNPRLQSLFTPDGWCWNIFDEQPKKLLRRMREELYELFGNGAYFHIGCDEAHLYSSSYYPANGLPDYLKAVTDEVVSEGRRPILWGDMIVAYNTNSDSEEKRITAAKQTEKTITLLNSLHPQSVIADWHYEIKSAPIPSTVLFQKHGFDVLGCPWDAPANINAHHQTALECHTYGILQTTWHTLHSGTSAILYGARRYGFPKAPWSNATGHRNLEIATLLRRVSFEPLSYRDCGFCNRQTAELFNW
ncbi:MAG: family 20 glycosylhydrolase [Clostridia bacterium]|nr:family 20 glycosylhydrolase [Clostridia bacterium]